jgi:solute carrier family 39 (zinc transporter), member 1/2/3
MAIIRREAGDQPVCGSTDKPEDYNTGLQVFAIFLILALSALSCSFPLIVKRFTFIPVPRMILFLCKHLGTGVIIATAFIHLVPTAFENLMNPCLPKFWTDHYRPMSGLIVMLGVLAIVGLEMVLASRQVGHTHFSEFTNPHALDTRTGTTRSHTSMETQIRDGHSIDLEQQGNECVKPDKERLFMQCAMLESGILFHSIFIGMAIAFSRGTPFVILLIAISFHQVFEGLALGSRIAEIYHFGAKSGKLWLMAFAYGVTAPLGQAVGLGIHSSFDLESQTGLLMIGIANALSGYVVP